MNMYEAKYFVSSEIIQNRLIQLLISFAAI